MASLLLLSGIAFAQADKKVEHRTVSQVLDHAITTVESQFVSAAEAMPEDKYSFAPTTGEFKGVRTFGQQVKHVAAVNYILGRHVWGEATRGDWWGEWAGFGNKQGRHNEILEGFLRLPS